MTNWKDCIVIIGEGAAHSPPAPRRRRIPRKCSTCTDRSCRQRGRVCNWINCRSWKGGEQTDGK